MIREIASFYCMNHWLGRNGNGVRLGYLGLVGWATRGLPSVNEVSSAKLGAVTNGALVIAKG